MRLKCQAYSTLSDSDEDPQAEARLTERMGQTAAGVTLPKATLVAPAALYLTAILEYAYCILARSTTTDHTHLIGLFASTLTDGCFVSVMTSLT